MQTLALSLVAVTALASLGVAFWTWRAMASVDDELHDFIGFEGLHFEDRSDRIWP